MWHACTLAAAGSIVAGIATLWAQASSTPGQTPEIHGVVLVSGTNQPVSDAVVSFYFVGAEQPKMVVGTGLLDVVGTVNTDATGSFSAPLYKLGYYRVSAKKAGYTASQSTTASVTLTADAPSKEARLYLSAPGHLTGYLVDEDTGKPIAGVRLAAARLGLPWVVAFGRTPFDGPLVTTDGDGQFRSGDLTPGQYMVSLGEQTIHGDRLRTDFSEKDLKAVDLDFPHTYWPGGHDAESATPVTVDPGATVSVGKISVKKVPHYRVHVRIPPSTCGPDDMMEVYDGTREISGSVRCRGDLLITGYPPGTYRLVLAVITKSAENREMALVPFVIADENIEITASLERGLRIEGKFIAADGAAPPDYTKLSASIRATGMLPFADVGSPVKVDTNGKFSFAGVFPERCQVEVSGTGAGHYIKEIRYNGIPVRDNLLPLDKSAPAQEITVVIDDKPAAIAGAVTDGEKPVGKAYVIAAKWPLAEMPEGWRFQPTAGTTADDQGNFQLAGLAPGEYRIVALRTREELDASAPGLLERALSEADKVEAGPNAFRSVNIEVGSLR
jgi:hypothetical protein